MLAEKGRVSQQTPNTDRDMRNKIAETGSNGVLNTIIHARKYEYEEVGCSQEIKT